MSSVSLKGKSLDDIYSDIITQCDSTDNGEGTIQLHKKFHRIMKNMDSLNFISEVIEENLMNTEFLNKEWTCFDIPFLQIYNNGLIDLKYHLFFPNKLFKTSNASYMIHSHKSSVLSSYVFSGEGYHTIHFEKDIQYKTNNYVEMRITKDFFHSKGSFNIVDSYEPHLVSNVSEPTFTIVLWTLEDEDSCIFKDVNSDSRSFYLEKNRFKAISDSDFLNKMSDKVDHYNYKDYHIQAICYFIQQVGYTNIAFLKRIQKEENLNDSWGRWISKLIAEEFIDHPFFCDEVNFINQSPELLDIRSAVYS